MSQNLVLAKSNNKWIQKFKQLFIKLDNITDFMLQSIFNKIANILFTLLMILLHVNSLSSLTDLVGSCPSNSWRWVKSWRFLPLFFICLHYYSWSREKFKKKNPMKLSYYKENKRIYENRETKIFFSFLLSLFHLVFVAVLTVLCVCVCFY